MKICSETATRQVIGEEYSRLKEECDLGFKQLRAKMCMEYLGCSHWLISLPSGKKYEKITCSHWFFPPCRGKPLLGMMAGWFFLCFVFYEWWPGWQQSKVHLAKTLLPDSHVLQNHEQTGVPHSGIHWFDYPIHLCVQQWAPLC